MLDAVVDRLSSYLESASSPGDPVTEAATYEQIRRTTDVKLPRVGHGIEALLEDVDNVLRSSVRTHAPGFMNPLWGGISLPSLVGEILWYHNTSMATYELSPFATLVERGPRTYVRVPWLRGDRAHHRGIQWESDGAHLRKGPCEPVEFGRGVRYVS